MFASRTNWRLESNRLALALERHRQSGRELIDLTSSNPTTCGFDYPEQEILAALANSRALTYSPESKGLLEARQAVAEYYDGRRGFMDTGAGVDPGRVAGIDPGRSADAPGKGAELDPERIVLLSGTSEGYSHIFRLLCEPGDEILVPAPSYPLFEFLADLNDARLTTYPLIYDHGWHMDLRALHEAFTPRTRAVMVVHPNNPTGSFVKAGEAAELAKLCAAQGAAIVADEVFLDYPGSEMNLTPERPLPGASAVRTSLTAERPLPEASAVRTFARGASEALTFTLSGLSKICALPQMKLAWIVVNGPEDLARAAIERLDVIADTYLSPGTPVQLAARELLGLRGGMQRQIRARVAANLACLDGALGAGSPLTRLACEGGWYAVVRAPSVGSDEAQAIELIERCSVLVHPGHFFNFAQDGYLVLSLISPEKDFAEGCHRLRQLFG